MTMPHIEQRKHVFLVKTKEKAKSKKVAPKKKVALELLHHRSEQISTILLMAGDNVNVWTDIELSIDPKPFCTSCHISSIKKKAGSKSPLKPKAPFKWVLWSLFQQHLQIVLQVKPLFLIIF